MDGKKSFIFSWNKKHRAIHEEALLHYFDRSKRGQKFKYQLKNTSEVCTRGKESEAENENMPEEGDQPSFMVSHGILHESLLFSRHTQERLENRVANTINAEQGVIS